MKQPLTPKPFHKLLAENSEKFMDLLKHPLGPTVGDCYDHWSRLCRREPPEGLTSEQWWLGIKFSRHSQYLQIPLRDTRGQPFVYMLPDQLQQALHRIDSQARGWVGIAEPVVNPENRDRFIVNSLIEEAITSSQLEGASTTRLVATNMIRAGRHPRNRSEQMILNNYRAMEDIRRLQENPLTIDALLQLHATLTADTLDDSESEGRIQRPDDERVRVWDERDQRVVHTPPPAIELPNRMQEMLRFANEGPSDKPFLHPVIRAVILHFWLAWDHPFQDGNGRTARALFYWSMLRNGYWMFEFTSISRYLKKAPARYSRAFLYTETDENDLTYFIVHQIEIILRALAEIESYIRNKIEQTREVERMLRRSTNLNHRQLALLAHAVRHADAEYTIRSHRTSHRVVYATARADLFQLAELNLLERRQIGRKTFVFRVPPNLHHRIQSL
ncbi:MAG: Fic family protein [Thiotrichales bacterium]|nr:Fic family protein [Thiotrichales bacterium]MCY4284988.1 Fic family protein [Thiotrichales bacterium]MCY4349858.1 Fic family protein [Thiotrichales bacterium]